MLDANWQNQFGMMRWAAFSAKMRLRIASPAELPVGSERTSARFIAWLEEFRAKLMPTDTLYFYDSEQSEWDEGFGIAGFAIVRDGELVDTLVMRMN